MTEQQFNAFLSPQCGRASFIQSYLRTNGVESVVLPVANRHHIYVKFPSYQYNPQFRMKTCIAHYDRAENTPGANDNSAAVAFLMDWAAHLARYSSDATQQGRGQFALNAYPFHNVRLIFTDGEEGMTGAGVRGQGAYDLAAIFKRLGITDEDVYVFDCVGCGTVPIIGRTNRNSKHPKAFSRRLTALEERVELLLRECTSHHLCLPLPYSDNAGFIAQGIAAVCITMLPDNEASSYLAALMQSKGGGNGLSYFVQNRVAATQEEAAYYSSMLPATWQRFHTAEDNIQNLTKESIPVMQSILDALATRQTVKV